LGRQNVYQVHEYTIRHSEAFNQGDRYEGATILCGNGRSPGAERGAGPHGRQRLVDDKDDKDRDSATGLSGVTQNWDKVLPAA
jgi:hypothetical protein